MMKEGWQAEWWGTVKEMKEWLDQFEDDDLIVFSGGSDSGDEFLHVYVADELQVNC